MHVVQVVPLARGARTREHTSVVRAEEQFEILRNSIKGPLRGARDEVYRGAFKWHASGKSTDVGTTLEKQKPWR